MRLWSSSGSSSNSDTHLSDAMPAVQAQQALQPAAFRAMMSAEAEEGEDEEDEEGDNQLWRLSPVTAVNSAETLSSAQEEDEPPGEGNATETVQDCMPASPRNGKLMPTSLSAAESVEAQREMAVVTPGENEAAEEEEEKDTGGTKSVPHMLLVPEEMWREVVESATSSWEGACSAIKGRTMDAFAEFANMVGYIPLDRRSDPDVKFTQLLKDIKREAVTVSGKEYMCATEFDALYNDLERRLIEFCDLEGLELEHKVQRIIRGCSRTVSGYDSYEIVLAMFTKAQGAIITPGMNDNSCIKIAFDDDRVTISSVNIYKLNRELDTGTLSTVLLLKTEITEEMNLETWETVRWMSVSPLDRLQECLNPVIKFKERMLASLLRRVSALTHNSAAEGVELLAEIRASLEGAISQTKKNVAELAHSEYQRGMQDAISEVTPAPLEQTRSAATLSQFLTGRSKPRSESS